MAYNGWKNYETWNIALWIDNDEGLYNMFRSAKRSCRTSALYWHCIERIGLENDKTPDGVSYTSSKLSFRELNRAIAEL